MTRSIRIASWLLPLTLVLVLLASMGLAQAGGKGQEQGDLLIRGGPADNDYIGNDIYNDNANDQTKTRRAKPGGSDLFRVRIENDSDFFSSFLIRGDGNSKGYTVEYWTTDLPQQTLAPVAPGAPDPASTPVNITQEVVTGTYISDYLYPAGYQDILVIINSKNNVKPGSSKRVEVQSETKGNNIEDVVAAVMVIKTSGGDQNGKGSR